MTIRVTALNTLLRNPIMPDGQFTPGVLRFFTELITDRRVSAGQRQPVTIDGGIINLIANFSYYKVDTEGAGASDNLDTINNGNEGDIIFIEAANAARTVVIKDGTGNIKTNGSADLSLDNSDDIAMLIYDGEFWKCDLWNISA